jgi:FkbM family methyltransferase
MVKEALRKLSSRRDAVYLGDNKALFRTIFGHRMMVDTRDLSLTPHLLLDGYWELWITKAIQSLIHDGMHVVEIGANVGYYTVLMAQLIGKSGQLVAFEANPDIFGCLHQNVEINGYLSRVTLVNRAVTEKSGKIAFSKLRRHWGSSSIINFTPEFLDRYHDEVDQVEVGTISLDDYFAGIDQGIDLVKIDAEGSEPYILDGMQAVLARNPAIKLIVEFVPELIHGAQREPSAFLASLQQHGFRLHRISTESSLVKATVEEIMAFDHCELYCER